LTIFPESQLHTQLALPYAVCFSLVRGSSPFVLAGRDATMAVAPIARLHPEGENMDSYFKGTQQGDR
jgi:hypothetical protein